MSRPQCTQADPGRAPRDALSWEPFAEGPRGPRQPEFTGKIREEGTAQRENAGALQRDPLQNSGSQLGYACAKTTQGQGKNSLRGLEGAVPGTHTELGIVSIPTATLETLISSGTWGKVSIRALPL